MGDYPGLSRWAQCNNIRDDVRGEKKDQSHRGRCADGSRAWRYGVMSQGKQAESRSNRKIIQHSLFKTPVLSLYIYDFTSKHHSE